MDKLNIFICENFAAEFVKIKQQEEYDDVIITPYPCICENKAMRGETQQLLQNSIKNGDKGVILCSKHCDIVKMAENDSAFELHLANYCFNHLANEQFTEYIVQKGGYIIGSGWLTNWRERLQTDGFDRETAKLFYREFCKELVFFDTGVDENTEKNIKELAAYLELPFVIIPNELEPLRTMIKSLIYEWRLRKKSEEYASSMAEIQVQCSEYSAIFDLISKIAAYTSKRDAIEKMKEIFLMVFGAQRFKYWDYSYERDSFPDDVAELFSKEDTPFFLFEEQNRFCIKLQQKNKLFGAIDASDFLFSKHIEKYLNFAIEIVKVCGLVLSNIEQYEKIIDSEKELQYLSFHDSLTGLYNRTYLNEVVNTGKNGRGKTAFAFDIDRLKYVNDNFGHAEGDKLITSAANVLKKCFREDDVVARVGGDEFLGILSDCDMEMAETIKSRIQEAIMMNNKSIPQHLSLSISIGYAIPKSTNDTLEEVMSKADELMYEDKMRKRR